VRKAVLATLWVSKWSGAIFRPRSSKRSVQKILLFPFHWKPRQSGVSLESPGLENIPQVPGTQAKVGQTHDAGKAVSATLWVLTWSGAIYRLRSSKVSVQKVLLCPFHCKPRPSGVSLESSRLDNICPVPGNRAEVGQNHDARKAASPTRWVLKWSGAISRPRSSKVRVQKVFLFPFHCKPRPSEVSLQSLRLENIPQVQGNRVKVGEKHDAPKVVSATLWILKCSGAIFWPRSS